MKFRILLAAVLAFALLAAPAPAEETDPHLAEIASLKAQVGKEHRRGNKWKAKAHSFAKRYSKERKAHKKHHVSWKSGVATWYSIADNTPPGSRATSSGKPLGSYGGFTCASRHFPLGSVLLVKHGGRERKVVVTDRGGLETIDLYKPASDWFGMGGKSRFRYRVVRRGW